MTPIQQTPSVHNTIDDSSNGFEIKFRLVNIYFIEFPKLTQILNPYLVFPVISISIY